MRVLIVVLLLIFGCKAKQTTLEKVITKTDTIFTEKVKEIQVPIESIVTINNPCDSTGILKGFKQRFKTKTVYVTVEGKNNEIDVKINLDSIKQEAVKEYVSKNTSEIETIEIIKYKIPKWVWWSLLVNVLLLLYLFRRFIPLLKLLPF